MILTDIPRKIKDLRDISKRDLIVVAAALVLIGTYLAFSLYKAEIARKGELLVTFSGATAHGEGTVASGSYFSSRDGSVYYPAGCREGDRVPSERRVWYESERDASARGLRPASNCDSRSR